MEKELHLTSEKNYVSFRLIALSRSALRALTLSKTRWTFCQEDISYHPGENLSKVCSVLKKKPCSLHVLEIWAPWDFIPFPPVSGVSRWEKVN